MSTQAKAARQIKSELKTEFPGVKFSVTSDSFAGGDAVRISYEDGPTGDQVRAISDKYQYGSFDGMRDIYEMTNTRDDIPQTKYVQVERHMSDVTRAGLIGRIREGWAIDEKDAANVNARLDALGGASLNMKAHRAFCKIDLTDDSLNAEDVEQALMN